MSWVKLDDRMPGHWRIRGLSDAAFRAHVTGMCLSAEKLTDGFLPAVEVDLFASQAAVAELTRLVVDPYKREETYLCWEPVEGGYVIHDYLDYNPSREQVEGEREAAKERMRKLRKGGTFGRTSANFGEVQKRSEEVRDTRTRPVPSRPDPSPPDPGPSAEDPLGERVQAARRVFEQGVGLLSSTAWMEFRELVPTLPEGWLEEAIEVAKTSARRPSWPFVKSVLERCLFEGKSPGAKEASTVERAASRAPVGSARQQMLARAAQARGARV